MDVMGLMAEKYKLKQGPSIPHRRCLAEPAVIAETQEGT